MVIYIYIQSFSRRFYPKRLTYVRLTIYTHFTFSLMAHCTSAAIRGSVSCSRTLPTGNRTGNLLITKRLLYLLYHCRPKYNGLFHIHYSGELLSLSIGRGQKAAVSMNITCSASKWGRGQHAAVQSLLKYLLCL